MYYRPEVIREINSTELVWLGFIEVETGVIGCVYPAAGTSTKENVYIS